MALKSTIFKAELQVADLDRGHFGDYPLTMARHPSENDERMMVRLLAFALYASPDLAFGKGLSSDDEPALWEIDLAQTIRLWIDVGTPDEARLRRASGRADRVAVLAYGDRAVDVWWSQNASALQRLKNLEIWRLSSDETARLGKLAERNMKLAVTHQEGTIYWNDLTITPQALMGRSEG